MNNFIILGFGLGALLAAIIFIASEVRRIWRERKKRRQAKRDEERRRSEIHEGVVSEDAYHRQAAFQAAMLHANSYFADAFASLTVGLMCLCAAALLHLVGPKFGEPMVWILVAEFLLIGLVILGTTFAGLVEFKFFQRDLSSEYRALLVVEEPEDED